MKKLLTMLFLMAFAWTSYAQLANESFDAVTFPPTGWTTTPAASGLSFARVTAGTYPTIAPHSGAGMVKMNTWDYSGGPAFLYTPALNFTAGPAFKVKFWMYRDNGYSSSADRINVWVNTTASTVGGTMLGTVNRSRSLAPVVAADGWYEYTFYVPATYTTASNFIVFEGMSAYGNNTYLDDVSVVPQTAPNSAALVTPLDGAIDVNNAVTLNWTAPVGGDPVTGYKMYIGTDAAATNFMNGVNVGNVLAYSPAGLLTSTKYYWKVVAANAAGDAAGAPIWSFTTFAGFGSLEGFVTNCYGVPVSGAQVGITGAPGTYAMATGPDGKYQFIGVPSSTYTLTAQKVGYNTVTYPGIVIPASTLVTQNVTLSQPGMTVLPNPNSVSVSPNEVYNGAFTVTNPGCGALTWTATIAYGSSNHSWFTMPVTSSVVAPSTNVSVPAMFNASGLAIGTVLTATVTFTSAPNVGTLAVPVTMVVAGTSLVPVTNLTGVLTDAFAGNVDLAWECTPGAGFLYYTVSRDGVILDYLPTATTYSDVLPGFGLYTYEVAAWYADGQTAPASVVVEWPNPSMTWAPAALAATVWSGSEELVPMTIGNVGEGTLAFTFPDYAGGGDYMAYCAATNTACDEFIGNVAIGTINNASGCDGYTNYTSLSTDLIIGQSAAIAVVNGGNPWSSDRVNVWIDYNHNGAFDVTERVLLTTSGGGASFAGTIAVPGAALPGPTTMRVRMQYGTAAGNPCGSASFGEVEDYAVNLKVASFITAVAPVNGFVAAGGSQDVNATFSATGAYAPAGVYVSQLVLNSNDVAHASVVIPATMTVTVPGTIAGVVTDGFTNEVLPGVLVSATSGVATFTAMTDDNGAYNLLADAGTYAMTFARIGYQTATVPGAVVLTNAVTTVDAQMFEEPYAPSCASASVNATDTQSTVTWCVPAGPYELLYDDGTAENYAAWAVAGNMNAVKFTPKGYPAHVVGAKLFVGDGSFPDGGVIDGAAFDVAVYNADASGMPGEVLSTVAATVTNLGWVNVTGLDATIASGDFFIVMVQGTP
ncbi:carboxypeptidase regulatory-like domain-containing protein, partial [bacterium]|nr:carboxypeptidase regulatory-like domain-containing protein [bacterium]